MLFLLIIPIAFLVANVWLAWSARSRRAPEIDDTIAAHQRFTRAMRHQVDTSPGLRRRR